MIRRLLVLLSLTAGIVVATQAWADQACEEACIASCSDPLPGPGDPVVLTWQTYGEYSPLGPSCLPTLAERAFGARSRTCTYYRHKIEWYGTQLPLYAAQYAAVIEQRRRLTHEITAPLFFDQLCVEHYGYAMRSTQGYDVWIEDFDTGDRLTPPVGVSGSEAGRCIDIAVSVPAGRRLACGWQTKPGMTQVYAYPECELRGVR